MHITYHGLSCFKLVAKTSGRGSDDIVIILGPYGKSTGLKPLQSKADLILVPHASDQYVASSSMRGEPIIIDMPGEYAVKGVNIVSLDTAHDNSNGAERGRSVTSVLDVEGMKVVYLGALGAELIPDQIDVASGADILFLPIGDEKGMDGKTAEVLARKIEAKVIIPMQYKTKGVNQKDLRTAEDFCSNIGNCPKTQLEKYTIKTQDIDDKVMEVVLLKVT